MRDSALTGTTRRWLQRLPARRRPYRRCTACPRVANRIAWVWPDENRAAQVLDDLLADHRGGRSGFPHWVTRELRRLQEFNQQHRVELRSETLLAAVARVLGACDLTCTGLGSSQGVRDTALQTQTYGAMKAFSKAHFNTVHWWLLLPR